MVYKEKKLSVPELEDLTLLDARVLALVDGREPVSVAFAAAVVERMTANRPRVVEEAWNRLVTWSGIPRVDANI